MKTLKLAMLIVSYLIFFCSCSKENVTPEEQPNPFVGTFSVSETSSFPDGRVDQDEYVITVSKSLTDHNFVEITNFAGLLKKKVLITVNGNNFTIPTQNFKSGSSDITIGGSGVLSGAELAFTYTVRGDFNWDAKCVSNKK